MNAPSTTPAPTIPPNWAPAAPAAPARCLEKSDYWIWDYGSSGDERSVLGGPSQTTDCLPASWGPTVTYAAPACPSYYTPACPKSNGVVTCCPWVYDFTCAEENWDPNNNGSMFRCSSRYTSQDTVTMTRTSLKNGGKTVQVRPRQTTNHLYALAVMYTTPPSSSLLSPITTSTVPPSANPSGLKPGAIAGIAVGSVSAVVLLGLLLWYIMRRRRKAAVATAKPAAGTPTTYTQMTDSRDPVQLPTSPTPKELPANYRYFELNGTRAHEME